MDTYIIIFAALAVFICLRLYSVLGQRTESEDNAFLNRLSVIAVLLAVVLYVAGEVPARHWANAHAVPPMTTISGPPA